MSKNSNKHPIQPIQLDEHGTARFKENKIINHLFDTGKIDLNALAVMDFPKEDRQQLAQLMGYSVDGFADLSYSSKRILKIADAEVQELIKSLKKEG